MIGVFRVWLTAYTHREVGFSAENDVFGRQIVSKARRRLLVIAHFRRKLVPAKLRRLLVIGIFRARLIAHTHRDMRVFAEICSQRYTSPQNIYPALTIKYIFSFPRNIVSFFLDQTFYGPFFTRLPRGFIDR